MDAHRKSHKSLWMKVGGAMGWNELVGIVFGLSALLGIAVFGVKKLIERFIDHHFSKYEETLRQQSQLVRHLRE